MNVAVPVDAICGWRKLWVDNFPMS